MNVDAVVVARSRSGALDVLTPVGGVPMITRSVRALRAGLSTTESADRVMVVAPVERHAALERACAGEPVEVRVAVPGSVRRSEAHAGQRAIRVTGDGPPADSWTVLHDAARPLAPPGLVAAVLAAASATG